MTGSSISQSVPAPTLVPLGDSALLVRFGTDLSEPANRAAIALSAALEEAPLTGVLEVMPNLVSVLLRFDPVETTASALAGELRLRLAGLSGSARPGREWRIAVAFDGPDLPEAAELLGMTTAEFTRAHNRAPLRVLATGFAPGFVYCGLHSAALVLPRRSAVRSSVPPGSILFAAGQTAMTATEIPTGWHLIGHTEFANFDAGAMPPTRLQAGDIVQFESSP